MSDIRKARDALETRILQGDGNSAHALRRAAFENSGLAEPLDSLITKVARHAYKVTDEDFAGVKAAGLTEEEIFEIVVCAAIGQATRQYDSGLKALAAAASGKE
jgi:alkylhydroperoxidase/carboxymuconolactone decarboxylase family protein YurZ